MKVERWFKKLSFALTPAIKPMELNPHTFDTTFEPKDVATYILDSDLEPDPSGALAANFLREVENDGVPFTIVPPHYNPTLREIRNLNGGKEFVNVEDIKELGKRVRPGSRTARQIREEHDAVRVRALEEAMEELKLSLPLPRKNDFPDVSENAFLRLFGQPKPPNREKLADTIFHGARQALLQQRNGQMGDATEEDIRQAISGTPDVTMMEAAGYSNPNVVTNLIKRAVDQNRNADKLLARIIGQE